MISPSIYGTKSSMNQQEYLKQIEKQLEISLCLRDFPHELVEKQVKPEIEVFTLTNKRNKPLVMEPIAIQRNEKEKTLIEPSINSCRISFTVKQNDDLDKLICNRFAKFFQVRAELFKILRRAPIPGYDLSFLITNEHLEKFSKKQIILFIVELIATLEKELNEMKLNVITQTRIAASYFVASLAQK